MSTLGEKFGTESAVAYRIELKLMTRLRIASKILLGDNSVVVKAIRLVRGIVLLFFGILHAREAGSPFWQGIIRKFARDQYAEQLEYFWESCSR